MIFWKVGGSLFDLPDLGKRLAHLYASDYTGRQVIVVAGGGPFADAVRAMDGLHHLPENVSHCLALDAMRLSARLLAAMLNKQDPIADPLLQRPMLEQSRQGLPGEPRLEVWDVVDLWHALVPELDAQLGTLPTDWSLTSDSIAAALAAYAHAERLVLCKSIDRPAGQPEAAWADSGAVDPCFPRLAGKLREVAWVNLRAQ